MWAPLCLTIVASIIWLFVDTASIDHVNSDAGAAHRGPVPAGVIKLSPDAYLVERDSTATSNEICRGGDGYDDGPEETRRISQINATYLECVVDQKWNLPAKKANPSFIEAGEQALAKPNWQLLSIIFLSVSLIFPTIVGLNELKGRLGDRRKERKEKPIRINRQLTKYRALQASYARDEIDDLQFDTKVQALVQDGFELPDDAFKS
jgi:hypothetical protein